MPRDLPVGNGSLLLACLAFSVLAVLPPAVDAQAPAPPPGESAPGFTGPSSIRPTPIQTSPDFVPILDRWRLVFPTGIVTSAPSTRRTCGAGGGIPTTRTS